MRTTMQTTQALSVQQSSASTVATAAAASQSMQAASKALTTNSTQAPPGTRTPPLPPTAPTSSSHYYSDSDRKPRSLNSQAPTSQVGGSSMFADQDLSPSTSNFSIGTPTNHLGGGGSTVVGTTSAISICTPTATLVPLGGASSAANSSSIGIGTPSHILALTSGITSLSGAVSASASNSVTDSTCSFKYDPSHSSSITAHSTPSSALWTVLRSVACHASPADIGSHCSRHSSRIDTAAAGLSHCTRRFQSTANKAVHSLHCIDHT